MAAITGQAFVWSNVAVATGLFTLIAPGVVLNIPPVPKKAYMVDTTDEKKFCYDGKMNQKAPSVAKRMFFTFRITVLSLIVHLILFLALFIAYSYLIAIYGLKNI